MHLPHSRMSWKALRSIFRTWICHSAFQKQVSPLPALSSTHLFPSKKHRWCDRWCDRTTTEAMVAAASQVADYPLSLIGVATIWISGPFLQYYQTRPQFPVPGRWNTTGCVVGTVHHMLSNGCSLGGRSVCLFWLGNIVWFVQYCVAGVG